MHPFIRFQLPSMGFSILCGTIAAFALLWFLRKKTPIAPQHILDGLIWTICLGFVGMKLLFWIVTPPAFPKTWADVLSLLSEGMVFYGGLIGGVLGVFICARARKIPFADYGDLFAPAFCLAHAGGRVGCFLAGCCYGMEYEGACAVHLNGVSRLPVQLMEAGFLVLLSAGLVWLFLRFKRRGLVTGVYMIAYAVWRFIIEFFRADAVRGFVGALSTSQFISIFILLVGLVFVLYSIKIAKKADCEAEALPQETADEELPETDAETDDEAAADTVDMAEPEGENPEN